MLINLWLPDVVMFTSKVFTDSTGKVVRLDLAKRLGVPDTVPELPCGTTTRDVGESDDSEGVLSERVVVVEESSKVLAPERNVMNDKGDIQLLIIQAVEELTGTPKCSLDLPFMEAGIDSLRVPTFASRVSELTGVKLSSMLIFEQSTPRAVVTHVVTQLSKMKGAVPAVRIGADAAPKAQSVGIGGAAHRWPAQCTTLSALQSLLTSSGGAVCRVPLERWSAVDVYNEVPPNDNVIRQIQCGSFVSGANMFDHVAFGVSSAEARSMDPQQRLLLEVGYTSLHTFGQRRESLAGSDIGFFLGVERPDWPFLHARVPAGHLPIFAVTGDTISVAAGRLSFVLDLHGVCVTLDTACSASIVAVYVAMLDLRDTGCAKALVASAKLNICCRQSFLFACAGMLAIDGRCKTFDAAANGYVRAEGLGATVLSFCMNYDVEDALKLAACAVRQDGRSASLTAPNGAAQHALLHATIRRASLASNSWSGVEAHGTGTPLGDTAETAALAAALTSAGHNMPLSVGAIKTNFGHAEPASGLLGLSKALCCVSSNSAPGNVHLTRMNPLVRIQLLEMRHTLGVTTQLLATCEEARAMGVSSFGYSGTIAHAVVAIQVKLAVPCQVTRASLRFQHRAPGHFVLAAPAGNWLVMHSTQWCVKPAQTPLAITYTPACLMLYLPAPPVLAPTSAFVTASLSRRSATCVPSSPHLVALALTGEEGGVCYAWRPCRPCPCPEACASHACNSTSCSSLPLAPTQPPPLSLARMPEASTVVWWGLRACSGWSKCPLRRCART